MPSTSWPAAKGAINEPATSTSDPAAVLACALPDTRRHSPTASRPAGLGRDRRSHRHRHPRQLRASRSRPSARRPASSTRSLPKTSASSRTRTSPKRCSACPASSSTASSARASASTCAARPDSLTKTLLNGHSLATADWFILDQLASDAQLQLPDAALRHHRPGQRLQVAAGGPRGRRHRRHDRRHTRNPLDLDSMTISCSAQSAYTDLADDYDPQASGLFSWKNSEATLGVLVAGVYQERNIRRDGVEVLGYFDADPSTTERAPGAFADRLRAVQAGARAQRRQLRRAVRADRRARRQHRRPVLASSTPTTSTRTSSPGARARSANGGTLTNATIKDGTAVAGTIASRRNARPALGTSASCTTPSTASPRATRSNIDFDVDFSPADGLERCTSRSATRRPRATPTAQPFVEFGAPASFSYDLRGKTPQVTFSNSIRPIRRTCSSSSARCTRS